MALAMTCLWTTTHAQVGINTTNPTPGAILDIHADDKGILIPRIELQAIGSGTQIEGDPTNGLLIYNTNQSIGEGFYYWYNTQWIPMGSEFSWRLTGNSGINPDTNFIGTVTNDDLVFRTFNTERMRILNDGRIVINASSPNYNEDRFTVIGNNLDYAINGYTTTGTGVYGENSLGMGNGLYGLSANIGVRGLGAHGAVFESVLNEGFGVIARNITVNPESPDKRHGLLAIGQNLNLVNFDIGSGGIFRGTEAGLTAFANNSTGTGILASGNGTFTTNYLLGGSGIAATGNSIGVYGIARNNFGTRGGGYFEALGNGSNFTYAYVGAYNGATKQKIIGDGTVSTIVKDTNDNLVTMFAPEAPEVLFQDYGIGQLVNGKASIKLDPILSKNILVNDKHPLKVFIQLEGDCNGVYVTNKSDQGFDVIELQGGTSNVSFAWNIVATRANEVVDGIVVSRYDVRFPDAPDPMETSIETAVEVKDNTLKNSIIDIKNIKENTLQAE